jgi:hypothetical protein
MTPIPVSRHFTIAFEGETLTFKVQYDAVLKRLVVTGPDEDLRREALLSARRAAVEAARTAGYLENTVLATA